MRTFSALLIGFCIYLIITVSNVIGAPVFSSGNKMYIRDRTGVSWDITEAVKGGFKPKHFKFGLGKLAIVPLSDGDLARVKFSGPQDSSVLGVAVGKESHAYSIRQLAPHEIANTTIAGNKIAAAY